MTGGSSYIVAAYILAMIILGGYSASLVRRLRSERESTKRRAAARNPGAPTAD